MSGHVVDDDIIIRNLISEHVVDDDIIIRSGHRVKSGIMSILLFLVNIKKNTQPN